MYQDGPDEEELDDDEDEGQRCPFCGTNPFDGEGGDCAHLVTTYDATFAYAAGMSRSPIEPSEPVGTDCVGELANVLLVTLLRLLQEKRKRTPSRLRKGFDLAPRLLDLLVEEHEGARLYDVDDDDDETDPNELVERDPYIGMRVWGAYLDAVLETASGSVGGRCEWTSYTAGGPGLASSYPVFWAEKAEAIATLAQGLVYADAEALEEACKALGSPSP